MNKITLVMHGTAVYIILRDRVIEAIYKTVIFKKMHLVGI